MSISTKAELRSEVRSTLEEDSTILTDGVLDNKIVMAEAVINRRAPDDGWTTSTLTGTLSSRQIAVPTGFVAEDWLELTTFGTKYRLTKRNSQTLERFTANGVPAAWAIIGRNVELDVPCDRAHTFDFRNKQALALSGDSGTNWLLTAYPDVYVYGTLFQACLHLEQPDRAGMYRTLFDDALRDVAWLGSRKRVAPVAVDPALASRGMYDINTDDSR